MGDTDHVGNVHGKIGMIKLEIILPTSHHPKTPQHHQHTQHMQHPQYPQHLQHYKRLYLQPRTTDIPNIWDIAISHCPKKCIKQLVIAEYRHSLGEMAKSLVSSHLFVCF